MKVLGCGGRASIRQSVQMFESSWWEICLNCTSNSFDLGQVLCKLQLIIYLL